MVIGVDHLNFPGGGAGIGKETAFQCAKYKYVSPCLILQKRDNSPFFPRPGPNLCWAISMNLWCKAWPQRSNVPEGRLNVQPLPTAEFLGFEWNASEAIGLRCDVTSWEDQVNLFQTGFDTFGSLDVVVRRALRSLSTHDEASFTDRERWGE